MTKKIAATLVLLILLSALSGAAGAAGTPQGARSTSAKIDPQLSGRLDALPGGADVSVILSLPAQADLSHLESVPLASRASRLQNVVRTLQAQAEKDQRPLIEHLEKLRERGLVKEVQPLWIANAVAVTASPEIIHSLAARPDVALITENTPIVLAPSVDAEAAAPTANIASTGAPQLWALGFRGQGIVVANLDSGVDIAKNPDLAAKWRGGTNSWFDPTNDPPTTKPYDNNGHGTATMSLMVGETVGMAPGATWIAAKVFPDFGDGSISDAIASFGWLLNPDGNAATDDAPHVVNNSWTLIPTGSTGCFIHPSLQTSLKNLLAAGILPVFSAGNYRGKYDPSDTSPGNYPEALAVGSIYGSDGLSDFSSVGPSACRPAGMYFPDLVGYGDPVLAYNIYGGLSGFTGTSFSAPQVAGGLALLLSAYPSLTPEQQRLALIYGAVDLGTPGPDNTFGYGRFNILNSYHWVKAEINKWSLFIPVAGR